MKKNKALKRYLSFALSLIMLFTSSYIVSALSLDAEPYITLGSEKVSTITLDEQSKLRLHAVTDIKDAGYCWQILDKNNPDRFISIDSTNSSKLWLTYALVESMLSGTGSTAIRCQINAGGESVYTAPVTVNVSYSVNDRQNITATTKNEPIMRFSARAAANNSQNPQTHSIIINYLFDNNAIAFEPFGATIGHNEPFSKVVESPPIVGYEPFRRDGEDYVDASIVNIDIPKVTEDIVINVIYEPALTQFAVHHHFQNLLDDDYSINFDKITYSKALTGSIVGDGLALDEPGFRPLAYEKLAVAADGSTVIEIRYDRNYYLVDFDMNGGYGSEPVYTRFGATVGVNTPIRHGYVFDGWELVSYGDSAPTAEQSARYEISSEKTITVPDANLKYRARWITQQTKYTMVFWKENANDNGYSYWGYLPGLTAMSGDYVSARDLISKVDGIDDEQYFTFNPQRSDSNVLVEGDGSTIVNVYYTRNYYTLTFKAPVTCNIPEGHIHGDECYDIICGKGHIHDETCISTLICEREVHEAHTAECLICGLAEHIHGGVGCNCNKQEHSHSTSCYRNVGNRATPYFAPSNPENGQIYRVWRTSYIYINGSWYEYSGSGVSNGVIVDPDCGYEEHTHGSDCSCDTAEHTHGDGCYRDTLHTHGEACYEYSCGTDEHIHEDNCYRLHCGIPNHSHTTSCNRTNNDNTFKIVYRKYEQSLEDLWPVTDERAGGSVTVYDQGERWSPVSSSLYNAVLVYISKMPPENLTLELDESNAETFVMNYYLQVLDGEEYDVTYGGKNYELHNTIRANYNYVTYEEDFFLIPGFNRFASNPAFSNGQINSSHNVNFYYDRIADKPLEFKNNDKVVKSTTGIMYGAPLKEHNFVPDYPDTFEPNAYTFAGWYTSPGCYDGTEVDWDTITMPADGIMLYAKWAPIQHTVKVFLDATQGTQIGEDQIVDHKAFALAPSEAVQNGKLIFQGWFYKDTVNGEEVEKAFVFTGIPVTEDMNIYAKWSSHALVNYTIHYVLKETGEKIADSTYGEAIAGHNKTFNAKTENELYEGFQTGFYPLVSSHTITMGLETEHEFTFEYIYVEAMPYLVRYVNAVTGQELHASKKVLDNKLSVVTETFIRTDNMMPDAYQKRLALSASGENVDEYEDILDNNVITFYYSEDSVHAYYRVVHYVQNILGDDTYREYRSEETVGSIGETIDVPSLQLTGFEFNGQKTKINSALSPTDSKTVSASLDEDGLLIELYYDRLSYNYTVRYLLNSTDGEEIYPTYTGRGKFGEQIVEYAEDLDYMGYTLISPSPKSLTLSANEEHNVFEFIYQEKTVSLKYEIIGPDGSGTLSQYSENLRAISGQPDGSTPTANNGFKFVGWFKDFTCTVPVSDDEVADGTSLSPKKQGNVWTDTTYYAKFVALETDLTITTENTLATDENQTYIFKIKGKSGTDTKDIDLTVAVVGNGSVTIEKLPTGEYTVTEQSDWSWRYETDGASRNITLEYSENGSTLTFNHERRNPYWLDGNAVKTNIF